MIKSVLLIVADDPRSSPRPAEALRVAAGLVPWGKVPLTLFLCGPAVLLLATTPGLLRDEDNLGRYWRLLAERLPCAYVEEGQAWLTAVQEPPLPIQPVSRARLAEMAAASDAVLRF